MIFPKCFCVWYLYGRRKYKYTISVWSRDCCWLLSVASTNENYNFWFLAYWVYISKWVNIKFIHTIFATRKFWCSRHVPCGKCGPIKGMKDSLPRRKKTGEIRRHCYWSTDITLQFRLSSYPLCREPNTILSSISNV